MALGAQQVRKAISARAIVDLVIIGLVMHSLSPFAHASQIAFEEIDFARLLQVSKAVVVATLLDEKLDQGNAARFKIDELLHANDGAGEEIKDVMLIAEAGTHARQIMWLAYQKDGTRRSPILYTYRKKQAPAWKKGERYILFLRGVVSYELAAYGAYWSVEKRAELLRLLKEVEEAK